MTRMCPIRGTECIENECAWWVECGDCAIPILAKAGLVRGFGYEPKKPSYDGWRSAV